MKFSILMILSQTLGLIRREKLLVAPYIFLMMIVQLSESYFPHLFTRKLQFSIPIILFFVIGWAIELFFKGITIKLTLDLALPQPKKPENSPNLVMQYIKLLCGTVLLMIPIGLLITVLSSLTDQSTLLNSILTFIVVMAGFSVVMILAMVLTVYPVIVLRHPQLNLIEGMTKSILFVKLLFRESIMFLSLTISILFITLFLTFAVKGIPMVGPLVLPVFIQGIGYAFIYILSVIFYLNLEPFVQLLSMLPLDSKELKGEIK